MQAITTRYYGPTGRLGSRIRAKSASGHVLFVGYDDAYTGDRNHARAAQALAEKLGWSGTWAEGALDTCGSNVYVHIARKGEVYIVSTAHTFSVGD